MKKMEWRQPARGMCGDYSTVLPADPGEKLLASAALAELRLRR